MERRSFLKKSALASSSLILPFKYQNNKKIKLAILGTGWWGTDILLQNAMASGHFEIIGLCDVDSIALQNAAKIVEEAGQKKPSLFSAYQEMYALPGLQAVAIATPTHWHALQFIDACKKGLHVFLEKPISYDIREGQAMLEAKQRSGVVVQVDFPRVMAKTNNLVKTYIDSGEAGKILQVKANINNPSGPLVEKDIPDTFDFETFCGPAPKTKFLCSPNGSKPNWRGQYIFNRGIMVDWGIHYIHNIRQILGLDLPDKISATGGITRDFPQDNPDHLEVRFDFQGLPVYWSHKTWGYTSPIPKHDIGVYYYGEKATIFAGDLGWEVYPKNSDDPIIHGDVRFRPGDPEVMGTYTQMIVDLFTEFAKGIRNTSNQDLSNPFEEAFKTTSCVNYGDIAYRINSGITIEKESMHVLNNSKAQSLLKRDYRNPFEHPYKG